MPRLQKERLIESLPPVGIFLPQTHSLNFASEITLTLDEMESIRLVDLEHLSQADAAEQMAISAPTLNRILMTAHEKIAAALWHGSAIKIEGGLVRISPPGCGHKRRLGTCPFQQNAADNNTTVTPPCPRCHRYRQNDPKQSE